MLFKKAAHDSPLALGHVSYHSSSNGFPVSPLDAGVDEEDITVSFQMPNNEGPYQGPSQRWTKKRTQLTALMVVIMGALAGAGFLYVGISSARDDATDQFERRSIDLANGIDGAWKDYETAALWVHQTCIDWRLPGDTHCNYGGFERLYHYLVEGGLDFYGIEWVPNITKDERKEMEARGQAQWDYREGVNYTGFMGQEPDPDNTEGLQYAPRSEQPFYFPIHYAEPFRDHAEVYHYDLYSAPWERPAIDRALETWKPALTGRFRLVSPGEDNGYSVVLYHPGVPLPDKFHVNAPRDLANVVLQLNPVLERATRQQSESLAAYLYDTTNAVDETAAPEFLSGISIDFSSIDGDEIVQILPESNYSSLKSSKFYFERKVEIGGRTWVVVVVPIDDNFDADLTFITLSGTMIFVGSLILALWMLHNMNHHIEMDNVITRTAAETSLVFDMFPLPNVRDRMIQDARDRKMGRSAEFTDDIFDNDGTGLDNLSETKLHNFMTGDGLFGSKPIAEIFPYTTIMFADIAGFSAWASARDPTHVFQFLEIVYHSWDKIARRRGVIKVESVRDSYTAVAGLPKACEDHAIRMAKFATDCSHRVHVLCHALEKILGPDTATLAPRFGLHSGQVLAGVLRGEKSQFQLFGDTVHTAAQIKTTCIPNKIHMSQETANLLTEAGFGKWCIPRAGLVLLEDNKNEEQTFFLQIQKVSSIGETNRQDILKDVEGFGPGFDKMDRLIHWNVEVLSELLCRVVAHRETVSVSPQRFEQKWVEGNKTGKTILDEMTDSIAFPETNNTTVKKQVDPQRVQLDPQILFQLEDFCRTIASMYRDNAFHNFAHASHVVMSVVKIISRMVDPKDARKRRQDGASDHTFGIGSDPLTHFCCAFAAMTHNVDHHGVPNDVLVREGHPLAQKYENKSILEQNSVELVWNLLEGPKFQKLRNCICNSPEEYHRFRSIYVNAMMATDILDVELGAMRTLRWNRAFSDGDDWVSQQDGHQTRMNRKATAVIEHLMQASDLSHTMQHWNIYLKWNENLFQEAYQAYRDGRLQQDPSETWYAKELSFFDNVVIPLANKLYVCGVFGVSSDELLNYAQMNRRDWSEKGETMVQHYLKNAKENGQEEG